MALGGLRGEETTKTTNSDYLTRPWADGPANYYYYDYYYYYCYYYY
jgi:hypothetical protein